MKTTRDQVRNVRAVQVTLESDEVVALVRTAAARHLGLPDDMSTAANLRVELNDKHGAYVSGEVPLTREQLLEGLGVAPDKEV